MSEAEVAEKLVVEPLEDRVAIQRTERMEKTRGGIVLPPRAQEAPNQGRVVAVGPGLRRSDGIPIPMRLEVGDLVMFGQYVGTDIEVGGHEVLIVRESEVFARIQE